MFEDPKKTAQALILGSIIGQGIALQLEPVLQQPMLAVAGVLILIGCVLLAAAKGHSKVWGLLGLFSCLGVLVLLLLPDRSAEASPAYARTIPSPSSSPYAPPANVRTNASPPLWMVFLTVGSLVLAGFGFVFGDRKMTELRNAEEENNILRAKMVTDSALLERLKSERETLLAEKSECSTALQKALRLLRRPAEQETSAERPQPAKPNKTPYLSSPPKLPATSKKQTTVLQAVPVQNKGFTATATATLDGSTFLIQIQLTGNVQGNVPGEVVLYAGSAEVMRKSFSGNVKPSAPLTFKATCNCANADQLKVVLFP